MRADQSPLPWPLPPARSVPLTEARPIRHLYLHLATTVRAMANFFVFSIFVLLFFISLLFCCCLHQCVPRTSSPQPITAFQRCCTRPSALGVIVARDLLWRSTWAFSKELVTSPVRCDLEVFTVIRQRTFRQISWGVAHWLGVWWMKGCVRVGGEGRDVFHLCADDLLMTICQRGLRKV